MPVTATPVFVQTPKAAVQQILPADTTTAKTLVTAGTNGTKVTGIIATSDDTSRIVKLAIVRSAVVYVIGTTTIAANAGNDGTTASTNMLTSIPGLPVDNDGQPYLFMSSGDTLTAAVTVTVTAAKTISLTAVVGDF